MASQTKKLTHKVVIVHWWDAVTDTGWKDEDGVTELLTTDEEHLVWSVGVIVKRDKQYLYMVSDWGLGDNPYNRVILIPRGMVRSVRTIKNWRRP